MTESEATEQYGLYEINLQGSERGNPYVETQLRADFRSQETGELISVKGFYRGKGHFSIRFMPLTTGLWTYETHSNDPNLDDCQGTLEAAPARGENHGRVLPAKDVVSGERAQVYGRELPFRFAYEDGTDYVPFGTTCYAWISQDTAVQDQTLQTLATSPFNKVRMCVFPKFYDFNTADPPMFAYQGSMAQGFDHSRFNEDFFENLDRRITQLDQLGIQADVILLHPYDKPEWGFSRMTADEDRFYLSYMARRYGAYKNVWWSLANEYDLMPYKSLEDWRSYARVVMADDAFGHLRSIHNCLTIYDYNEPWCTHCSIQRTDVTRTTEDIEDWRQRFHKPVICDEAGYEGNIYWGWGNLSAQEMVRRFWQGCMRCGYVTHGETFIDKGPQIWWAHGGRLYGESPARIAFMRDIFEQMPRDATPLDAGTPQDAVWPLSSPKAPNAVSDAAWEKAGQYWDVPVIRSGVDYSLVYFGWYQPLYREFALPEGHRYKVDVIDTWNMTVTTLPEECRDRIRVNLGQRQYMAVRLSRVA